MTPTITITISGPPKSGKTSLAYAIAQMLRGLDLPIAYRDPELTNAAHEMMLGRCKRNVQAKKPVVLIQMGMATQGVTDEQIASSVGGERGRDTDGTCA